MIRGNGLNKVFIDFSKTKVTLAELYGNTPVPITALTKVLWAYINKNGLRVKKEEKK